MELQRSLIDYERTGIAIFAISYDTTDVLASFASKRGITFPLLADAGSRVIRELGLLNAHIPQQQRALGNRVRDHHFGLPYPGTFVLDEAGVVRERWFEQSYRIRPTAVTFLEQSFDIHGGRSGIHDTQQGNDVHVTASVGTETYHPHQRLNLNLDVQVADGLHVYVEPIPTGYTPLSIEVEPISGLEVRSLDLPAGQKLRMELLDETFTILEGHFRAALPLVFTENAGDVVLTVRLSYQACSNRECYLPEQLYFRLPLRFEDLIRD